MALETENKMWDPGGVQGTNIILSTSLHSLIVTASVCHFDGAEDEHDEREEDEHDEREESFDSRTKLDSHANMPVLGRHSFVISDTGKVADVKAFSPDHKTMRIKIVDAAVRYDSPYDTNKSYILVIRNALYVPSMDNNLIPPFMRREAGITVKDTPKIQMQDPTVEDHSIFFPETEFQIPLSLWGVFSYFPTTKPSLTDMTSSEEVYVLTTSR
jgi:hypothetical protein